MAKGQKKRPPTELNELLGKRISMRRKELGMTMQDAAARLEYSPNFFFHIEHGTANIPVSELGKLAEALSVNIEWLLGLDGPQEKYTTESLAEDDANLISVAKRLRTGGRKIERD